MQVYNNLLRKNMFCQAWIFNLKFEEKASTAFFFFLCGAKKIEQKKKIHPKFSQDSTLDREERRGE